MRTAEPDYIEINCLGLRKCGELYVFIYDDDHRREALQTLGRFATNPLLSFTWLDAAELSKRIRQDEDDKKQKPNQLKGQTWKMQ